MTALTTVRATARNTWRSLTSMRTALVLLFLLALAAVPGALLPQRELNEQKTLQYIADNGKVGEIMDKLQLFDVFSSFWFTAIYALLFISLVGCLTPRIIEHAKSLRAKPVATPRNLERMPRHVREETSDSPDEVSRRIMGGLRGWRKIERTAPAEDGSGEVIEISAEKGYLREFGNLVFHFALLGLLVSIAAGKMWGYEGTRTLVSNGQSMCTTSTAVYDSFRAGNLVDGTRLNPFCIKLNGMKATYLETGQPDTYEATVQYQEGDDLDNDVWRDTKVRVNDPLRIAGDRVYLLGQGYATTMTVTFPNGEKRTQTAVFRPDDLQTMLSSGAMRFDTPGGMYPNQDERRTKQIAIEGIFAPTADLQSKDLMTSTFPAAENPQVAIFVYQGDTGLDTGAPQNVYTLDQDMINQGRLLKKGRANLKVGESTSLADGTKVSFDGFTRFASLQVSHDPAQNWVLVSSVAMLVGLLVSLLVRRRRVWARIRVTTGDDGLRRTVVEMAGLARTDQAGWGEGFQKLATGLIHGTDRSKQHGGR